MRSYQRERIQVEMTITEQRAGKDIISEHTEISDKESADRQESIVTAGELSEQDHSYKVPIQRKEKAVLTDILICDNLDIVFFIVV